MMMHSKGANGKILFLASSLKRSGPTKQLLYLISGLDRRQFEPAVLTMSSESARSMKQDFEMARIPCDSLNLTRLKGLVCNGRAVHDYVCRWTPAIVHGQGFRADMLLSRLKAPCRRVTTVRANLSYDYPRKFGRFAGAIMASRHYRALQLLDQVFCVSSEIQQDLNGRDVSAEVVHNGVDITGYEPATVPQKLELRKDLGIPLDAPVFISVGALITRKDPLRLIRGFRRAYGRLGACLILLGDGELMAACRAEAAGVSGVRLQGNVSDVRPYLRAADVYVSVSTSEGIPNGVLEALACGLPTCLSDIPAHREILRASAEAGRLFPVKDEAALAEALRGVYNTSDARRPAALVLAREHFSAEAMSRTYATWYTSLSHE